MRDSPYCFWSVTGIILGGVWSVKVFPLLTAEIPQREGEEHLKLMLVI